MAVYVDDAIWHWKGRKWCHLMADDEAELHRFARLVGLHRLSYQGPPKTTAPHYDITGFERDRAVRCGAIACKRAEIVEIFRRVRVPRQELDTGDVPLPRLGEFKTAEPVRRSCEDFDAAGAQKASRPGQPQPIETMR